MPTKTRLTKGKIVSAPEGTLAPAPFPLATWAGGRRRVPSQARSLRTRGVILESARELANSKGVGSVTMQMVAAKAKIAAGTAYQFFDDRDAIFFHYPNYAFHKKNRLGSALRAGDFKLITYYDNGELELYRLSSDIGEEVNLSQQHPEIVRQLKDKLDAWLRQTDARLPVRKATK